MSRFGPTDPFYRALDEREHQDRIARFAAADVERHRQQMFWYNLTRALPAPIVDHDPGDEDRSDG